MMMIASYYHLTLLNFQIISLVSKKTGISDQTQNLHYQLGGTFMKLENEWRETIKQRTTTAKIIKPK